MWLGIRPVRDHREEPVVFELGVHTEPEQDDEQLLLLHDHRHGGSRRDGGIGADDQIDFVDVEQLGVDARHRRGLALVVVIDELDRAPEQAALGVDLLLPDLHAEQRLLAVRRQRAGQRHGEADLDRLARRAPAPWRAPNGGRERRRRRTRQHAPPVQSSNHVLPPVSCCSWR